MLTAAGLIVLTNERRAQARVATESSVEKAARRCRRRCRGAGGGFIGAVSLCPSF